MGGGFLGIPTQLWSRVSKDLGLIAVSPEVRRLLLRRARWFEFGMVLLSFSSFGLCSAEISPLDRIFSSAPAGDVNSQMLSLEAKVEEARHDLSGVCVFAMDSVGSAEFSQKLTVKLNGLARKVVSINASCQQLRDSLTNTLKSLEVSGGGYLVEGRNKQAEDLERKIVKCEEFLAQCRTIPPKLEDVKRIFEEADVFRLALADIFGKQSADEETRAALEKRLSELVGPLDASPSRGYFPPQIPPKMEPSGEAISSNTNELSADAGSKPLRSIVTWISFGGGLIAVCGAFFLFRKVSSKRALNDESEKIPSEDSRKLASVSTLTKESEVEKTVLKLMSKDGTKIFETRLDQAFGKLLLKANFEDRKFFADQQFSFARTSKGWFFVSLKAINANNLNGAEVPADARVALREGDIITIGKQRVCPLRVSFE